MTTTVNLRKLLHRKSAEYLCPNPAGNTVAGGFITSENSSLAHEYDNTYYVGGASAIWSYNEEKDAWIQLPNSGIAGTFGAGACGESLALSTPAGIIDHTASAGGTTTTIPTALNIVRDLTGVSVRVHSGTGVGYAGTIAKNTLGANAVLTVTPANGVAFDATTKYRMYGGSLWFMNAGAGAVGLSVYDRATNVWTARVVTNLPTTWATDGQLVSTPGLSSNNGLGFVNGTATAGGASTITLEAAKTMLLNQWTNYQIRIKAGTGAGQLRVISSNTAGASSVVTVSAAWAVNPDATSTYVIEGNDDVLYLLGNAAQTLYKYSIAGNTWSAVSPGITRGGTPAAGMTADWIDGVKEATWTDGTYGNHTQSGTIVRQNGRYIYSFRGNTNQLDVYDIPGNQWLAIGGGYGNSLETFGAGSCAVDSNGLIYIQKDATGRIFQFDVARNTLDAFTLNPVPQGNAVAGDKMFMTTYRDGATEINFLNTLGNTRSELTRWLVI